MKDYRIKEYGTKYLNIKESLNPQKQCSIDYLITLTDILLGREKKADE